ncbi:FixH family protein [uncultured Stenotrophomonas sp.]|uniref:FixH family protein n=1 Tax=uncultured Stenotrophomonas sp. TaxID=165438 RepID=A0A1Y5Q682_9GAMM|nr:FixH family protein [uncultured Stenotrophomonas sp.]
MNEPKKSLWGIPALWLVVGLPLAAVAASVWLLVIAIRSGGADSISDPVDRVLQIQTADLGPDANARELGLSAVLRVEDGIVEVLPATGQFPRDTALQLTLEHPARQANDLDLELLPQGPGWRTEQAIEDGNDWLVQLRPADGQWRLKGRLPKQQHATRLSPWLGEEH